MSSFVRFYLFFLLLHAASWHNFHHEFPNDYRNGILWYHYDPTKWLIAALAAVGAAANLKVFPKNEIQRGVLYMKEKQLKTLREKTVAPVKKEHLPAWSWEELQQRVAAGSPASSAIGMGPEKKALLVVVDGFVHDVSAFAPTHPGGLAFLRAYAGRDATDVFMGRTEPVVYKHSHAAQNLLSNMRVAVIRSDEDNEQQAMLLQEHSSHQQQQQQLTVAGADVAAGAVPVEGKKEQ